MTHITDEEIITEAYKRASALTETDKHFSFRHGAQWYRKRLEESKPKWEVGDVFQCVDGKFVNIDSKATVCDNIYKEGDETQVFISRITKYTFPSYRRGTGQFFTMDNVKELIHHIYHKFGNGKDWSDFSRHELEYILTEVEKDRFIPTPKDTSTSKEKPFVADGSAMDNKPAFDTTKLQSRIDEISADRKWLLQIASTIPHGSFSELMETVEKVERWLRG